MERPRVDKRVRLLVPPDFRTVIEFHPEYQGLDPYAENLPRNVTNNDDEFLEIAQALRAQLSCGLSRSAINNDETYGVGVNTGTNTDFDQNPMLAELYSNIRRNEPKYDRMQFGTQVFSYTIYPNGIGIFRSVLHLAFIGGISDYSILEQRYMTGGDLGALRLILNTLRLE